MRRDDVTRLSRPDGDGCRRVTPKLLPALVARKRSSLKRTSNSRRWRAYLQRDKLADVTICLESEIFSLLMMTWSLILQLDQMQVDESPPMLAVSSTDEGSEQARRDAPHAGMPRSFDWTGHPITACGWNLNYRQVSLVVCDGQPFINACAVRNIWLDLLGRNCMIMRPYAKTRQKYAPLGQGLTI